MESGKGSFFTSRGPDLSSHTEVQPSDAEQDFTTSYGLIVMAVVIVFGNGLVLLTVRSFARRLVADIFIFCLSLLDLVHTMTSILLAIVFKFTRLRTEENKWATYRVLCQVQAWFTVTTQFQSAFIVTLITLERFVAVSRPFFYKTHINTSVAIKTLLALLFVSILISSAPLLGWDEYVSLPKLSLCLFHYDSSYAILVVVIGYTDLVLVSYCFLAIRVSLRKFMKRQTYFAGRCGGTAGLDGKEHNLPTMSKNTADAICQSKRLIKVSAMVSFVFYFSWLPLMIAITLGQIYKHTSDVIRLLVTLMPVLSPLANPLIYFFSWERYKRSYIRIVKRVIQCWSHCRQSGDAKNLVQVPGPDSSIRSVGRNPGFFGTLHLVERDDDRDKCLDVALIPKLLANQESLFPDRESTSHLVKSLPENGKNHSKSSDEIQENLYEEAKFSRRHTMAECVSEANSDSSTKLVCDSQTDKNRRHTIGEFSDETSGDSKSNTRTSERFRKIHLFGRKDFGKKCDKSALSVANENAEGIVPLIELTGEKKSCPEKKPNDTTDLALVKHKSRMAWYGEEIDSVGSWDEGDGNRSRKSSKREEHFSGNVKIIDGYMNDDLPDTSHKKGSLITERINKYLTSIVDDRGLQVSRKKSSKKRRDDQKEIDLFRIQFRKDQGTLRKDEYNLRKDMYDSQRERDDSRNDRYNSQRRENESRDGRKYSLQKQKNSRKTSQGEVNNEKRLSGAAEGSNSVIKKDKEEKDTWTWTYL